MFFVQCILLRYILCVYFVVCRHILADKSSKMSPYYLHHTVYTAYLGTLKIPLAYLK